MFNISIEQKVLMKALEYLEPTVGKNASGLGDNCIAMKTTGNGSIEMYTTNTLEFTKLEAIVAVGGVGTNSIDTAPYVDFKRFKSIIASIPANEVVSLEANVNDLLINFALKKVPIRLVGCTNGMIPLPTNQFPTSTQITVPKSVVKTAIDNVSSIIIDSTAAPIYNCMRIYTVNTNVEFTALDMTGKRTFCWNTQATNNNPTTDILVEVSKLKKSIKIFEDFNELEFNMDNSVICINGSDMVQYGQKTQGMITGISYYARRINGAFPSNIKTAFDPLPSEFAEINMEELKGSLARVKAIEDQTTGGQISFEVSGNTCTITLNSGYGNIEDDITLDNSVSQSFKTIFKYDHLSDIMKVVGGDILEVGILPNHPANYVIKSKGSSTGVLFTIPGLVGTSASAQP